MWPRGLVSIQLSQQVQNYLVMDHEGLILFPIPIYQHRGLCSQGVTSLIKLYLKHVGLAGLAGGVLKY